MKEFNHYELVVNEGIAMYAIFGAELYKNDWYQCYIRAMSMWFVCDDYVYRRQALYYRKHVLRGDK